MGAPTNVSRAGIRIPKIRQKPVIHCAGSSGRWADGHVDGTVRMAAPSSLRLTSRYEIRWGSIDGRLSMSVR
jgi:hypothetical protein